MHRLVVEVTVELDGERERNFLNTKQAIFL